MEIGVGVVGCGYWAERHLAAWGALAGEGVRLAAVCDLDPVKAERAAARFGAARWYTDARLMFEREKLGLVDVATRMESHRALVEQSVTAGVPVIVQKPMAPTMQDCMAMVTAADAGHVFFAVHENFRFQPAMTALAEEIAVGAIGAPSWARFSFRTGVDVYASQPYFLNERRLVILDLGIHLLDLARVFLGEVVSVACTTQRRNQRLRGEDTATILLSHVSGAVSVVEATYESQLPHKGTPELLVEIEGPQGAIVVPRGGDEIIVTSRTVTRRRTVAGPDTDIVQESVLATCRHLLEASRSGKPAATAAHDNLRTFALVEAAYTAATERRLVDPAAGMPPRQGPDARGR